MAACVFDLEFHVVADNGGGNGTGLSRTIDYGVCIHRLDVQRLALFVIPRNSLCQDMKLVYLLVHIVNMLE